MGLVTWAVMKAELLPSLQKVYFLPADEGGVGTLTKAIDELLRRRVLDECLVLNNVSLASMLANDWQAEFALLAAELPRWTAILCVAGYTRRPEERVAVQEKHLNDICRASGVEPHTSLPGAPGREAELLNLLSNPWTKSADWKLRAKGSSREIFFLSPLSKVSELVAVMHDALARSQYPAGDVACYVQPMVQGRGCHCEFILPCDESDAAAMRELQALFLSASESLMKHGAFFSRPYGAWASMVYDGYPEGVAALHKLKGVFDPNNVLNPGKLCFAGPSAPVAAALATP